MIYNLLVQRHEQDRQQGLSRTDLRAENVWQSLALMTSWWDPQSPNCKFKTYFYNKVPPQEVPLYQRPADQDAKAWQEAQKKNPDPTCLVPTLAVGFTDLQKRMDAQNVQSQAYDNKLQEIRTKLEKMQQHSTVDSADKFKRATEKQRVLVQRVIQVLKYTQVLQQRGLSITQEEEDMRSAYEGLYEELARSEQFGGTLGEKWSQLQLIKESGRVGTSELERELINTDRQAEVAKVNFKKSCRPGLTCLC
ncbi:hypothetical protein DM01DRAFT_1347656 [Hesseltinella vesiculosa]|uniref:Nucleoporin Nup54 alpha-helical domain-containing protein n=1 Tax=Hesseltinella vesiculosa TaxID=101127 RepID=A0A1X2GBC1_9FUNG|nr:hypothetical protein DM01DRAFT_1347656 [Hesseltinella vesiculosa]